MTTGAIHPPYLPYGPHASVLMPSATQWMHLTNIKVPGIPYGWKMIGARRTTMVKELEVIKFRQVLHGMLSLGSLELQKNQGRSDLLATYQVLKSTHAYLNDSIGIILACSKY